MSDKTGQMDERVAEYGAAIERLRNEVAKILVGQTLILDRMLIALIAGGHVLLEGVPGLAKTLAAKTLAASLGLDFRRVSFTPDLLPADVLGTTVYNPADGSFDVKKGPVFTNLLLADEINRAPAKVQSALLEAMQEGQVTIGDTTYPLPEPFLVIATQNPIEHEGTYPLPEAQIDRFMLKCRVAYPARHEEKRIMERFTTGRPEAVTPVLSLQQVRELHGVLDGVYCDERVADYILDVVFATREPRSFDLDLAGRIEVGASPRASLYLNMAARANALLQGRTFCTPQDVKDIAHDVLRHRIILSYEAEAEELSTDDLIRTILDRLPVP